VIPLRLRRREPEEPHPWFGQLRLGSRIRFAGRTYVLADISYSRGLTLGYHELGSWETSHLVDPHRDCRPRRRMPWRRTPGRLAGDRD
jgi:hypothetical protein